MHNDSNKQDKGQEENVTPLGLYLLVGGILTTFVLALLWDALFY